MDKTYRVIYDVKNLGMYGLVPGIQEAMQNELMRVYDIYANKANGGITDKLNKEFNQLYPNYREDNKGKEWYDLIEYNQFLADGYNRLIMKEFNETNISPLLDFYVQAEEISFTGCLKVDHNVTIEFYLKEVES